MTIARPLLASCVLLALLSLDARAAPGDVVVPAHRTRDGHWVPANVPPLSGGTHVGRRPARNAVAHRPARAPARASRRGQPLLPPLLVDAPSVRR